MCIPSPWVPRGLCGRAPPTSTTRVEYKNKFVEQTTAIVGLFVRTEPTRPNTLAHTGPANSRLASGCPCFHAWYGQSKEACRAEEGKEAGPVASGATYKNLDSQGDRHLLQGLKQGEEGTGSHF